LDGDHCKYKTFTTFTTFTTTFAITTITNIGRSIGYKITDGESGNTT
jgi:hypothetical protein